jgi:hypothetical protein
MARAHAIEKPKPARNMGASVSFFPALIGGFIGATIL